MKKQCIFCNASFTAKRADARFCSSVCRAHHHNETKGRAAKNQTQPETQQTQLPVHQPPMAQPIPPQHFGLYGLENPVVQRLQDKIEVLQDDKRRLEIEVLQLKANAQLQENMAKFREEMEPPAPEGLEGIIERVGNNDRLMGLFEKFIEAKFIASEGGGEGNVFSGVEGDKRDKLHALLEISKTLDDKIVDVLLGIAGKASQDQTGFIQGFSEAAGQPAETNPQTTETYFLP